MKNVITDYNIKNPKLTSLLTKSDLHTHTLFSDGSVDEFSLVDQFSHSGIENLCISDHNGLNCYTEEFFKYSKAQGINIIPGSEIDCGSGLDILVYDNKSSEMSEKFYETIQNIITAENKERLEAADKALKEIIKYLDSSANVYPWFNWSDINDDIKKKLNISNLQTIHLKTGELNTKLRSYVSKPHIIKLLDSLNLINWDLFIDMHTKDKPNKKEKVLTKIIFNKITPWKYDEESINEDLLKVIKDSGFVSILAHPGKTFHDIYPEIKSPTEKEYKDFISHIIIDYGVKGAECDYRAYHDEHLPYNELAKVTLQEIQEKENIELYATAGSDSHHGFKKTIKNQLTY